MCCSLQRKGFDVVLIVADGQGNEIKDNVKIIDVGRASNRFLRILNIPGKIFDKAKKLKADLYHVHDPELLPISLKLRRLSLRVVFDSHEDVPKQILNRDYLPKSMLWLMSICIGLYEIYCAKKLNGIICATPYIASKFSKINNFSIDINNYPLISEFDINENPRRKRNEICYIGNISLARGIKEMITALSSADTRISMNLCGKFSESGLEESCRSLTGWNRVVYHGFIGRKDVVNIMERSILGFVILHPIPNYIDSLPVKMFEYMASGLPVIASNFPLWKEIIAESNSGICVDPLDTLSIAAAINYIFNNPDIAEIMGENGKKAVNDRYNWNIEETKLIDFYNKIFNY
jgi:glycosyltransferase involved in cell wall biosynthesis